MGTTFCVSVVLNKSLSCCVGDSVNLSLNTSGKSKVTSDLCAGPCSTSSVLGGTILGACKVDNDRTKYTISYDSGVLKDYENPLLAEDISCVTCVQ